VLEALLAASVLTPEHHEAVRNQSFALATDIGPVIDLDARQMLKGAIPSCSICRTGSFFTTHRR